MKRKNRLNNSFVLERFRLIYTLSLTVTRFSSTLNNLHCLSVLRQEFFSSAEHVQNIITFAVNILFTFISIDLKALLHEANIR